MNALVQKRESVYTHANLLGAIITHGTIGFGIIYSGVSIACAVHSLMVPIVVIAMALLVLAIIWPSYRIMIPGLFAFWLSPAIVIAAMLSHHYHFDIIFDFLPYVGIGIACSLPWSIACITFARLRLPIVYPPGYCRSCGYDLSGLKHDRCPECGVITNSEVT